MLNQVSDNHSQKFELSPEAIEEKIVKKFQSLYPHYYNVNNISRIAN